LFVRKFSCLHNFVCLDYVTYLYVSLLQQPLFVSIREKEEDLEKRQFFLNRELRPLMEIPGEYSNSCYINFWVAVCYEKQEGFSESYLNIFRGRKDTWTNWKIWASVERTFDTHWWKGSPGKAQNG